MPAKVKARVLAARNLPVMDRSSETTDAFAEVEFKNSKFKTEVCRKSLNPTWPNSDWFRFDVDDCDLQDEPLQIRIMDYDIYSANDAIGKVYIDLNPLLLKADKNRDKQVMLSGWLPIFDTMHGVRGEVNVNVKVELFSDLNKFRASSCGVLFFCSSAPPEGYRTEIISFVEKLCVNDDPEYQWIDKIRTPRASNEARQALFMKLSSIVQRKIGSMALELGANAVLGYRQNFDLEGDSGIVARAIGTAVKVVKESQFDLTKELIDNSKTSSRHASGESDNTTTGCSPKVSSALSFGVPPLQQQQQLKSKLSTKISSSGKMEGYLEILEHPFLTLRAFPEGFVQRIGGLVCCRSVKLLDGDLQDNKHKALREAWWQEIRHEIRTHAMTLGCNLVVGYSEDTSIFEDIVVLSANGTAVTARLNPESLLSTMFGPLYTKSNGKSVQHGGAGGIGNAGAEDSSNATCSMLHIPFHSPDFTLPFTWSKKNCHFCGAKNAFVPDVMFTTIEPPVDQLLMVGRGCVLQAKVIRLKKDLKGENNAKEISDALPFIEYEIHRQLINKLKVKGMNAIFGLKMTLTLSDRVMVATALGTAVYLAALPSPSPPRLVHHRDDQEYLMRMQRRLEEKISENMDYHGITNEQVNNNRQLQRQQRCSSSMEEDDTTNDNGDGVLNNGDFELNSQPSDHGDLLGNKDVCVLEIDDTEDSEILESILDRFPPPGIQVFSTEELIGISKGHIVKSNQLFSQIWRGKIQPTTKDLTKICQRLLSAIYFKLRKLKPCLVSNLTMKADVDEENEIQLTFTGIAIALAHDGKTRQELASELTHLEENSEKSQEAEATVESASLPVEKTVTLNKMRSPNFYMESKAQEGIVLTPQSFVCGGRIEKYLGNLNFFLIRETSSLREAGGLSHFVQSFICEIQCIVRAHVMSLGGNALLSYFMSEFVIMHNPHKNQAQCLLHVGGDAVLVNFSPLM